ncbi:hypothetical protein KQ693_05775 [Thermus sp. PS18]|uniref:hypothetical protein n=1 Tax=Thermus sp. PS18 TaxID=2849039 RepID=UPI0022656410|nr:hypothetical protein [Thermus sp. PS18]UZX16538.1 hypothetical protein KQ693_05775 [Thermus sp. PS18]
MVRKALALLEEAESRGLRFEAEGDRLALKGPEEGRKAFVAEHGEAVRALKPFLLSLLLERGRGPEMQARLEFALAYEAKLEAEAEENVPDWLAYATWCLLADALNGFVLRGLGELWPAVQEAVAGGKAKELRARALERWAEAFRRLEAHRMTMRWEDPAFWEGLHRLSREAEEWAWKAFLVELARKNPEASTQEELDPWVDLRPWALYLAREGRRLGLVWREAA